MTFGNESEGMVKGLQVIQDPCLVLPSDFAWVVSSSDSECLLNSLRCSLSEVLTIQGAFNATVRGRDRAYQYTYYPGILTNSFPVFLFLDL